MHRTKRKTQRMIMKTTTTKQLVSLVGIAIVTPMFALAILVSARSAAVGESDVTLLVLALCGAVISGLTGFGRRTIKAEARQTSRTTRYVMTHS